ncbi:MAG: hypothetical protein M3Y27_18925 [Acidobacteriota bacterium]|nr:hypothetical protein [Acidobacteriota bacterium]
MPTLTIPQEHAEGLSKIMDLSPDDSEQILGALANAKSTNVQQLTRLVSASLPSLPVTDARAIVGTLISLYAVRTSQDMSVDSFVEELIKASLRQDREPEQLEALRNILRSLLSVRPLSMISKARTLHTDHENTFCSALIRSDLRAVFDTELEDPPTGFVVAHILKLGYHHQGKHTNLYVAMDKIDIDKLIAVLLRAKKKASTLSGISGKSGFPILAD